MKPIIKVLIWILFITLVTVNLQIFIKGIKLGEDIHQYEVQIEKLRQENIRLEKNISNFDSLSNTASLAAQLKYIVNSEMNTIYLDGAGYAYNRR